MRNNAHIVVSIMVDDPIHEIVDRAAKAGVPVPHLCKEAGVSISTFNRWKAGTTGPTLKKIRALLETLERLEEAA